MATEKCRFPNDHGMRRTGIILLADPKDSYKSKLISPMNQLEDPLPSLSKLEKECNASWSSFQTCVQKTRDAESTLRQVIHEEAGKGSVTAERVLDADSSLVLFGSFARHEMLGGSDCDWTLLIDGPAKNSHATTARLIERAIESANGEGLRAPGSSGTFGNLCFSHDLVHRIGGTEDSNVNLTRRILMLLESRPLSLSESDSACPIWNGVLNCILERYFEEDAHFDPGGERKVPRFLLNDLTRFWRTIGVDYASKYRDQGGQKWALRNAKLRLSRKLLFASGLAFCFRCQIDPPSLDGNGDFGKTGSAPFIKAAAKFAGTPPLEVLAHFIDSCVKDETKKKMVAEKVFGAYNEWLTLLDDSSKRSKLESLSHKDADKDPVFQDVRHIGSEFATGLKLLFFNRVNDEDTIANVSLEYVGF
jgi:predicted nucleotidyltransferase